MTCRGRYERHLLLQSLDPAAPRAKARLASGLGIGRAASVTRLVAVTVGVLAAAAAIAFFVGRARPTEDGFATRGGAWQAYGSQLFVYHAKDKGTPSRAGGSIGRGDELAFAYDNVSGKRYLLVFGVDENKTVYWYYPAWTHPSSDPVSIRIDEASGMRYLPEAVGHDLTGHELEVHAVFTDAPLSVKSVEDHLSRGEPLAADGAIERVLRLHVGP
jgi:hypothetical protein